MEKDRRESMKKTKIVCTIGPASEDVDMLVKLIDAGMNVARINFSHGDQESHAQKIRNIREAERRSGRHIGIMLDTKGPEIRTHQMQGGKIEVHRSDQLNISSEESLGNNGLISTTHENLVDEVSVGTHILIDDGIIDLEVTGVNSKERLIETKVMSGGVISNNKGVNVPGVGLNLPALTEKDIKDIKFGIEMGIDYIAQSFVRRAEDVLAVLEIVREVTDRDIQIIPKIESGQGVENVDEILRISHGLMVARGDLGVEIPIEEVPLVQKELIKKCNLAGKPVITATQMLDSMTHEPRPTRAEANDVANAILDGSDAVMLSGETAVGEYPIETVKMMSAIARRAEREHAYHNNEHEIKTGDVTEAVSLAVSQTVENLGINNIVATTNSGYTARMISKYRPKANIIAVTFSKDTARALTLQHGVEVVIEDAPTSTDDMFRVAREILTSKGLAQEGDLFAVTAGVPVGERGTTNLMRIMMVSKELIRGYGIGEETIVGTAVVANSVAEAENQFEAGDILVVKATEDDFLLMMQEARGIICEEDGLSSHAAKMSLSLGKPVLIAAKGAMKAIKNGEIITVDHRRGVVYRGASTIG